MAGSQIHLPRLSVLAAALLFSTGGAVIKAIELPSLQIAAERSGVAALVLLLLVPRWRRFWRFRPMLVGTAYAATLVLFVVANKLTTAANTTFLQATAPVYVLALAPLFLRERNRRSDLATAAALAIGIGLFFIGVEAPARTATNPPLGKLVAAISAFSWACTLIGLRWLARAPGPSGSSHPDDAGAAAVAGNVVAFAVCLPFALPFDAPSPTDGILVLYLGSFQIAGAYWFLTRSVARLPAVQVSLLLLIEPVLNATWAWLVHGERPGPWALGGCSVILVATLFGILAGQPARRDPNPTRGARSDPIIS